MAGTDDDTKYAKQRFDELMKIRAWRPWNTVLLKDELMEFAGELPTDKEANLRSMLRHQLFVMLELVSRSAYRLVYWRSQAPLDLQAKDILDGLLKDGKISKEEWGQAVWQRILRRADDGVLESVGPKPLAFFIAKAGIATLIVAGCTGITEVIVVEPFNFFYVFPLAIYTGLFIGIVGKLFYQLAWARQDLAKRIKYYHPHINLRLKI